MASDTKELSRFDGKKIGSVNVSTKRIKPEIVKNKFPIKEGDIFNYKEYDNACKKIHDMGIFKKADIDTALN
jgi:outer membrane protein assembly factor BamA